jgi:hypothetical protein
MPGHTKKQNSTMHVTSQQLMLNDYRLLLT